MPIQYWNYQLNGFYQMMLHLDERYGIGDIHETTLTVDPSYLEETLGGAWSPLGSVSYSGTPVHYWVKES